MRIRIAVRPVVASVAWSVCVCVCGHNRQPYTCNKNGWDDRGDIWYMDSGGGQRNHVLGGLRIPQGKRQLGGHLRD